MQEEKYLLIGQKIVHEGKTLYAPEYYDDGLTDGFFYKDEKAFNEDRNAVCYIPEAYFDDELPTVIIDDVAFFDIESYGYTRDSLERLLEGEEDDEGNPISVNSFFCGLLWACPETYLNELTY